MSGYRTLVVITLAAMESQMFQNCLHYVYDKSFSSQGLTRGKNEINNHG